MVVLAEACAPAGSSLPKVPAREALEPCRVAGVAQPLLCGTLYVRENRQLPSGREIPLNVVVLPALHPVPGAGPLFDLAGGPGAAATAGAVFYANEVPGYREHRDVVLVDQRGTGASHPLRCDLTTDQPNPFGLLDEMYPPSAVAACRDGLLKEADLTRYTTLEAADDLDAVRAWLGYERINLVGLSYGTRAALAYMKRHPGCVRSAVLLGVAPPSMRIPLHHASDAQRALDLLLDDCAADPGCHGAFPRAREEVRDIVERLDRRPAVASYHHSGSGMDLELEIRREIFMETIRSMLYAPPRARRVPQVVHHAISGDFGPFLDAALGPGGGPPPIAEGMYLSVTCAEDTRFINPAEAERLDEPTLFGGYRVFQQRRACAMWPAAEPAEADLALARSDTPVLVFSGRLDPVTPPSWAEKALELLPNGRNVLIHDGGHVPDGLEHVECLDAISLSFLDRGSADGLDLSCVPTMTAPPFAVDP